MLSSNIPALKFSISYSIPGEKTRKVSLPSTKCLASVVFSVDTFVGALSEESTHIN